MKDRQKIFLGLAGASAIFLLLAIGNVLFSNRGFPYGFYVFLRIVTCAALVGLILEKFPTWVQFILLLLAILYNPVIQIHLGDPVVWAWFNGLTLPALIVPWIVILKRMRQIDGASQTR